MLTPWLITLVALALAWLLAVQVNRRHMRRHDGSGDPACGVILFAEPIRWLFIIWGFASFCRGLRRAGCRSQIRLFRWCTAAGALLVIPDLVRQSRLLGKAEALARRIERIAAQHPGVPIYLVGYSSGCYVVLEACRRINAGTVQRLLLLAGSVSPRYPLEHLAGRVAEIRSYHSRLDLITAIGPAIFGTNDRRWGPGCGTVGFRAAPAFVVQRSWRPADVRLRYLGDHFSIASSVFVAREIAPHLITPDRA